MTNKIKRWVNKLMCSFKGHKKVVTFWTTDSGFTRAATCEWIRCECGKEVSFVSYREIEE